MEVQSPDLFFDVPKAKRPEGNGKLGLPALIRDLALHLPDGIPVVGPSLSISTHLTFSLGASRIGPEDVTVAVIVEGVENHREVIAVAGTEISDDLRHGESLSSGRVIAVHSQVKILVVVEQSNLGSFGGGFSGIGLVLNEISGHFRQAPLGFIQVAVDGEGRFDVNGRQDQIAFLGQGEGGQAGQGQGQGRCPRLSPWPDA